MLSGMWSNVKVAPRRKVMKVWNKLAASGQVSSRAWLVLG